MTSGQDDMAFVHHGSRSKQKLAMRIAIITDIHEDVQSLKKALRMIEIEKCDYIVCLGDILGYPYMRARYEGTRNASECISLVKRHCRIVLLGNHDLFHLSKVPSSPAGFEFPDNWYDLGAEEKLAAGGGRVWNYSDDHRTPLTEAETEYLLSLPESCIKEFNDKRVLFSHFVFPNLTGYVSTLNGEMRDLAAHFGFMKQNTCELSICGHMHIEGIGIGYEPGEGLLSRLFHGFNYYSYGERKLKNKACSVTVPALADNSQVNGFAVFDSLTHSITALSLNTNRRFIL